MNYYKAVEKKPEHGGGWAFMQLNRREGAAIYCGCGLRPGAWTDRLHDTAEEAERCFYDHQVAQGVQWATYSQANRCVICGEWTDRNLRAQSALLSADADVCESHFANRGEAATWLWERNPFSPGIQITASW